MNQNQNLRIPDRRRREKVSRRNCGAFGENYSEVFGFRRVEARGEGESLASGSVLHKLSAVLGLLLQVLHELNSRAAEERRESHRGHAAKSISNTSACVVLFRTSGSTGFSTGACSDFSVGLHDRNKHVYGED